MKTTPHEKTETSQARNRDMVGGSSCECGKMIPPVGKPPLTLTPTLCPECEEKYNENRRRERSNEFAIEKQRGIDNEIQRIIPPLCRSAKIEDFPAAFQHILLNLDGENGLYLWGLPGRGKTWAMAAVARTYIELGLAVERVVWGKLLYAIQATYNHKGQTTEGVMKPVLEAKLLIIDDLGTATGMTDQESNFAVRILLMILDERIENGLATGITTNKSPENIGDTFDKRILSRIAGHFRIEELVGPDRRADAKNERVMIVKKPKGSSQ